ncbi:MAG TPA: DJ-1/PfpI family protein [Cyclobacteriaceae bacterium]|jgi:putative intracellular protease/amidase|nr:DJ-1/PfpI family protein [Cyclobacteriaceae bacterium]
MKKNKTVLIFVFDGFADWEIAHASVGIRKSNVYTIKTIALTKAPVVSMGGLQVLPDLDFIPEVDLCDIDGSNTAMLILPGGSMWEQQKNHMINCLVAHCLKCNIPVASICGSTVMLADMGLLNNVLHTSNDVDYLKFLSPTYEGCEFYRSYQVVQDQNIITATGTASIEFARTIFETLNIDHEENLMNWFQYFNTINLCE